MLLVSDELLNSQKQNNRIHGRVAKSPLIKKIDLKKANDMLSKWHYLGPVKVMIAAFGHDEGCCVFTNLRSRIWESKLDGRPIELARVVGKPNHLWAVTSLIAQSLKEIKKLGYTVVVTYADPWNGNTGTIYRAGNWIYLGTTSEDTVYILDGKRVSRRNMYDIHGTSSKFKMKEIYGERIRFEVAPPKFKFMRYL